MPASRDALADLLDAWGLSPEGASRRNPPPSKNRVILCRASDGRRVLVKAAWTPGPSGVGHEARVLAALHAVIGADRSPLRVPLVVASDAARGVLALEWLGGAESLYDFHYRTRRHGRTLAQALGRALGRLHGLGPDVAPAPPAGWEIPRDHHFAELFVSLRPEIYARLSHAGIALVGFVQRHPDACAALMRLIEANSAGGAVGAPGVGPIRLLHGDLKPPNILRLPGNRPRLVLIDWERAVPGDPARDLGSLVSEYLRDARAPEPGVPPLSEATLCTFTSALLAGYRSARAAADAPEADFALRVARWAGLATLYYVYGMTHYDGAFSPRARSLAALAIDLLGAPDWWAGRLFGAA